MTDDDRSLMGFARFLRETADTALKYEKLTPDDRKMLERARNDLAPAIAEMTKLLELLPHTHETEHAREMLFAAMAASYIIGSRGDVADSSRPFWKDAAAAEMRDARRQKTDSNWAALDRAIIHCVAGDISKLKASKDKMTPSRDEIIAALRAAGFDFSTVRKTWPGMTTILDRMSALNSSEKF